jgi:hypothetical protein
VKWSDYNEHLVRRGEIILGFDVIDYWNKELADMNRGKLGEPFHYPDTFVLMLGYAKVYFHLLYRQTQKELSRVMQKTRFHPFLILVQ